MSLGGGSGLPDMTRTIAGIPVSPGGPGAVVLGRHLSGIDGGASDLRRLPVIR
jgi:hypothetical protein